MYWLKLLKVMFYLKIRSHFIFKVKLYHIKKRGKGYLKLRRISTWVQTRIMLYYEGKRFLLQSKLELFKFNQSRISLTSDQEMGTFVNLRLVNLRFKLESWIIFIANYLPQHRAEQQAFPQPNPWPALAPVASGGGSWSGEGLGGVWAIFKRL